MLIQVAVPLPIRRTFDYLAKGVDVPVGAWVLVPFGKRTLPGIVVGPTSQESGRPENQIKEIREILGNEPVMSEKMIELVRWISDYYCAPIGEVCKSALPVDFFKKPAKKGRGPLHKETDIQNIFTAPKVKLTAEQYGAYEKLKIQIINNKFQTTLLHGVTGSGKTEIYLRLFEDVIKAGREAIFLVPEIGMTPQTVGRVMSRFGNNVAVYHSGLTNAARSSEWKRMKAGTAQIVIGTRSAVFAPFKKLGLIVVDEEHDPSYKQDENPRYNGRDTAVMRAKLEGSPCVLGSATPSIESFMNVKNRKYHYFRLLERPGKTPLPSVDIVDMKNAPKGVSFSPQLVNAISEALAKKEQVLLFLNRRGFSSFVLCGACGEVFTCPNCNITYSYHKREARLKCHYCDTSIVDPQRCSKCGSNDIRRLGLGTERIEEELKEYFPNAKVERFDRDVTTKAGARGKILSEMKKGETDILIGTQMITKGHDFPNVTLVGVLDADLSLNFPDFRSAERTFQLLTQVAGRSGRSDKKGSVIIQTYNPEHYAILAASRHDFDRFYGVEVLNRKELGYPPFGRVALIKFQGLVEKKVEFFAEHIFKRLTSTDNGKTTLLGPSPAPIAKIRNKFRWHILVKSLDSKGIKEMLKKVSDLEKEAPRGVKMTLDVDAVNII